MKITKNVNGSNLEIALEGRLDTMTAPELETELKNSLEGIDSLTLDFSKLEYISSAGLRVLLMAVKKAGQGTVINASDAVKEIFETTGFDQIIDVR